MHRRVFLASAALTSTLLLAGCDRSSATPSVPARAAHSMTPEQAYPEIVSAAHGFSVGPADAQRVAYVYFDPQCPHCAVLWQAAAPLVQAGNVRMVWIPVGLLNRSSTPQGATILGAADPVAAMNENEGLILSGRRGITVDKKAAETFAAKVAANTELFNAFRDREDGVPLLVVKVNGRVRTHSGSLPTELLRRFLGI